MTTIKEPINNQSITNLDKAPKIKVGGGGEKCFFTGSEAEIYGFNNSGSAQAAGSGRPVSAILLMLLSHQHVGRLNPHNLT